MSKLFNLKEWLTVADAAKHLSIVFGEEVTEADVLRLALDKHLRLSVYFVNHTRARCGKVVQYSETELREALASGNFPQDLKWHTFPAGAFSKLRPNSSDEPVAEDMPVTMLMSDYLGDGRYVTFGDTVEVLDGVWDLPMIGGEQLDIEHEYQNLIGGPAVTLSCLGGALVEGLDGEMCQIQESFDNNEYQGGSNAQLEKLKQHIANNGLKGAEAEALLNQHKEQRKKFLEEREKQPANQNYYPASGLPEDAVIVVRTEALRDFEQSINGAPKGLDKPLTSTERNTLLTIIAALCNYSAIEHQGRGAAGQIARLTEEIGAAVSDDTVRRLLKMIPDALETRMK